MATGNSIDDADLAAARTAFGKLRALRRLRGRWPNGHNSLCGRGRVLYGPDALSLLKEVTALAERSGSSLADVLLSGQGPAALFGVLALPRTKKGREVVGVAADASALAADPVAWAEMLARPTSRLAEMVTAQQGR